MLLRPFGLVVVIGLLCSSCRLISPSITPPPVPPSPISSPLSSNRPPSPIPGITIASPALITNGTGYWSHITTNSDISFTTPSTSDPDNRLVAVDLQTRQEKWQFPIPTSIPHLPTLVDGVLYFGTLRGARSQSAYFYAIAAATGQQKWAYRVADNILSPGVVYRNTVFFRSLDGFLYALDRNTGQLKWKFKPSGKLRMYAGDNQGSPISNQVTSAPVVQGGMVYVGCQDGKVYGIDITTGRPRWQFNTHRSSSLSARAIEGVSLPIVTAPVVVKNLLIVATYIGGEVYAVNLSTQQVKWKLTVRYPIDATLLVANNLVYFTANDSHLHAVDIRTGKQQWKFRLKEVSPYTQPVLASGKLFMPDRQFIYALNSQSGAEVWQHNAGCTPDRIEPKHCYPNTIMFVTLSRDKVYFGVKDIKSTTENRIMLLDVPLSQTQSRPKNN